LGGASVARAILGVILPKASPTTMKTTRMCLRLKTSRKEIGDKVNERLAEGSQLCCNIRDDILRDSARV
jgi:hypothetical protein